MPDPEYDTPELSEELEKLSPHSGWCFSDKETFVTDYMQEVGVYKDFFLKLKYHDSRVYSLKNIFEQIDKGVFDVPSNEQYDEFIKSFDIAQKKLKGLEESQTALMEAIVKKAYELEVHYDKRQGILEEICEFSEEAFQRETILSRLMESTPHNKAQEKERFATEAAELEKQIRSLTERADAEDELLSSLDFSIKERLSQDKKLDKTLADINDQVQAYQAAYDQGNPDAEVLLRWLNSGIEAVLGLNQIYQIEAHGLDHLEVIFNIPPAYPCLVIRHSDFSKGFDIVSLKLTKANITHGEKESEDTSPWKTSYADFEEIKQIDLTKLLQHELTISSNYVQVIPELIGMVYHELIKWSSETFT